MKNHRNTRNALALLTTSVALHAALFGVAALALTEGEGYYVAFRMPSGYLVCTEIHQSQRAAFSEFKKSLIKNELAVVRN